MKKMQEWMELRALAPITLSVYTRCARRFIEHVGKPLGAVKTRDVEQYLLELARKERSPRTRNVNLAAIRCALRAARGAAPVPRRPRGPKARSAPEPQGHTPHPGQGGAQGGDHQDPRGFTKIRHGGLLAPTNVNGRLARAKDLLRQQSPPAPADQHDDYDGDASEPLTRLADLPWMDLLFALTGIDLKVCPLCHSRAVVRLPLPPDCRGPPGQLAVN
jgi:hypothetical protein